LVRIAHRFDERRLAQVRDEHTATGRHIAKEVPFPLWVPDDVRDQAAVLDEAQAMLALGPVAAMPNHAKRRAAANGPRSEPRCK
jgi:hypothetical protein